jgi:hypothetical protein
MIDEIGAKTAAQMGFCDGYPYTCCEPLSEGSRRHFDAQLVVNLRVTRSVAAPLSKVSKII